MKRGGKQVKMEVKFFSDVSVDFQWTAERYIPETIIVDEQSLQLAAYDMSRNVSITSYI
jgi:hypothetical protein